MEVTSMRIFALVATVLMIASSAYAQNADPPLFAAFKSFCVDTGARSLAVKAAVEAAGGTQRDPSGLTAVPTMTVTLWDVAVGDRKMIVFAGTMRNPAAPPQVGDMIACNVNSPGSEDASIAAIRDWVGFPPSTSSPPRPPG